MLKKIFSRFSFNTNPSALLDSIRSENMEKVKDLLDLGAKTDPAAYRGLSDMGPLALALQLEHKPIISLLLERGADMQAPDALSGLTPVEQIFKYRAVKPEMLSFFIEKGLDVKKPVDEKTGWTALHLAADRGTPAMIDMLVDAGADINAKTIYGETPLHRACSMRNGKERAAALLRAGAGTDIADMHGRTPGDVARQHLFEDTASLFLPSATPASTTPPPPRMP